MHGGSKACFCGAGLGRLGQSWCLLYMLLCFSSFTTTSWWLMPRVVNAGGCDRKASPCLRFSSIVIRGGRKTLSVSEPVWQIVCFLFWVSILHLKEVNPLSWWYCFLPVPLWHKSRCYWCGSTKERRSDAQNELSVYMFSCIRLLAFLSGRPEHRTGVWSYPTVTNADAVSMSQWISSLGSYVLVLWGPSQIQCYRVRWHVWFINPINDWVEGKTNMLIKFTTSDELGVVNTRQDRDLGVFCAACWWY